MPRESARFAIISREDEISAGQIDAKVTGDPSSASEFDTAATFTTVMAIENDVYC
jgi:hypothetical protein